MNKLIVIIAVILLPSCSTLKKSKYVGAASGAVICGILGASLGQELSPDKESEGFNRRFGGAVGAASCGALGYLLGGSMYKSDPRNFEDKPIDFNKKKEAHEQITLPESSDLNLSDLRIEQTNEEVIPLIKGLPNQLKTKVKRQKLIKYKVSPQTLKTKDGRVIYFSGGQAIEHKFVDTKGE
jgi:hypothetical protein